MDTTDSRIVFDESGVSDYYYNFMQNVLPNWDTTAKGYERLLRLADRIRKDGKGRDYDCILGVSGGLDSSYTVLVAKEKLGLRPLIFHVDAGWDTEQAVSNIEKLINGLGVDLYTEVIDWEEMKDLQVAFLRSQIPDIDYPQDLAFFSALYKFAATNRLKYVLTGANYSTECCREPEEWGAYPGIDLTLVRDIHSRFGKRPLKTFPMVDIFAYKLYYRYVLGIKVVKPLDFVPYLKKNAETLLEERFGWKRFLHKHHESRFTRFYEDYWLPRKFGFDKRKAHFSSLILTDQMTREEALERLSKPEVPEEFWKQESEYIANKLSLSYDELQGLFLGENKTARDYKNKRGLIGLGTQAMVTLGLERRLFR